MVSHEALHRVQLYSTVFGLPLNLSVLLFCNWTTEEEEKQAATRKSLLFNFERGSKMARL